MLKSLTRPTTLLAAASLFAASAFGEGMYMKLDEAAREALPPEAKAQYDLALKAADRVDIEAAVQALGKAAELAPNSIDLQFLALDRAIDRAQVGYGESSIQFYELAEGALARLLANTELGVEDKLRAARQRRAVVDGKNGITARDEARYKSGHGLVMQIRSERRLSANLPLEVKAEDEENTPGAPSDKKGGGQQQLDPWAPAPGELESVAGAIQAAVTAPGALEGLGDAVAGANPFGGGDASASNPFGAPTGGADPFGGAAPPAPPAGAPNQFDPEAPPAVQPTPTPPNFDEGAIQPQGH